MGILNTLETMLNVMERSKEVHILGVNVHQQYSQLSLRQTLFRAVTKSRELGIFPGYNERDSQLLLQETKAKWNQKNFLAVQFLAWKKALRGTLATTSLGFEYVHRKSPCEMLISGDDISNDVITLGTCFSMFVYIRACFHFVLIGVNLTAQLMG